MKTMQYPLVNPKILQTVDPMGADVIMPLVFQPKLKKKIERHFAQGENKKYLPLGRARKLGFNYRIIYLVLPNGETEPFVIGPKIVKSRKSTTYHAFNLFTGEHIIIKMTADSQKNPLLKEAERKREIKLLASMKRYKGAQMAMDKFFIGQKYIPGITVVDYFKKSKKMAKETADPKTLAYLSQDIHKVAGLFLVEIMRLHAAGFIHRDIKCSNCILQYNPKTKIAKCQMIDFGGMNKKEKPYPRSLSTTSYRAPELTGKQLQYTQASDIYSTGLALEKIFRPFNEVNLAAFIKRTAPEFKAGVDQLINEMMAEDPKTRPSAKEAKQRLDELEHLLPTPVDKASAS